MTNYTKRLIEKLKNDGKFKTRFACITVACVVIVATGITVPVVMHNNKIAAEEVAISTGEPASETTVAETTTLPDGIKTVINEENGTTSIVGVTDADGNYVYTTVPETTSLPVETTAPKAANPATTKTSTTKKPTNNAKPAATASPQTTAPQFMWTEADLQYVVNQAQAYAKSKGFKIYPQLTEEGTSWANPVTTDWCRDRDRALQSVKFQVDECYNLAVSQGALNDTIGLNIFYKEWHSIAPYPEDVCWGIYVVY